MGGWVMSAMTERLHSRGQAAICIHISIVLDSIVVSLFSNPNYSETSKLVYIVLAFGILHLCWDNAASLRMIISVCVFVCVFVTLVFVMSETTVFYTANLIVLSANK